MQHYLGLQFCNLQPIPKVLFISSLVPRPFILTYFYDHEVNVEIYVDVVNKCVIFYITANDFNKHLEKIRSGMSAGNILQAACSTKKRIGDDVPIYK